MFTTGVGMLIGFRLGGLGRPIGYGRRGYGYDYIHEERDYNMRRPFHCALANVSEFLRVTSELQELNIDEGEVVCAADEDVCFGRMTVRAVNFTTDVSGI